MPSRAGQQLGNYQLIRTLAEGGFAEIYLGEHIHLGTNAAIKVLHAQLTSEDLKQFREEARSIAPMSKAMCLFWLWSMPPMGRSVTAIPGALAFRLPPFYPT